MTRASGTSTVVGGLRLAMAVDQRRTIGAILVGALSVLSEVAIILTVGSLVGALLEKRSSHVLTFALVTGALFFVQQALLAFREVIADQLAGAVDATTLADLLTTVDRYRGPDLLLETSAFSRLREAESVMTTQGGIGQAIPSGLGAAEDRLRGLAALAIVAYYNPVLAGAAAIVVIVAYQLLRTQPTPRNHPKPDLPVPPGSYLVGVSLDPSQHKEFRFLGLDNWLHDKWVTAVSAVRTKTAYVDRRHFASAVLLAALIVILMLNAAGGVRSGRLSLTDLVIIGQAALLLVNSSWYTPLEQYLQELAPQLTTVDRARVELNSIAKVFSGSYGGNGQDHGSGEGQAGLQLRLRSVAFSYGEQDLLRDLTLNFEAGTTTAIVGPNGVGKTTLAQLCSLDLVPDSGVLLLDGYDSVVLNHRIAQAAISTLFQDYPRYPLTVTENITFDDEPQLDQLEYVCDLAGALAVVRNLPAGWATPLSGSLPGGVDLSGGEWQRIAIARALYPVYFGPARLLILDEPMASVDARSEHRFYESFLKLPSPATTIVISHRMPTVRLAGQIISLDPTGAHEIGTHQELMHTGGNYHTMYRAQAAQFESAD